MDNAHLFELLNAGPGLAPAKLLFAVLLAKWLIVGVPLGLTLAWFRGSLSARTQGPGLPSDHVTVFWGLALSALFTRRFAPWRFPLLAIGLSVGWSRVYLGVHFPYDILAALPVVLACALAAHGLRRHASPVFERLLD